ncbi:hypothetical protein CANARDRAFT_209378 [[Candida] arabinofermentans NRRL YB-2248]|uniref:Acyl carrier protein n=1 Tax=[Candida] arabinofermentans NRRL YB-2248 TaxID=983967 RepID=A0A1E4SUG1_9ASCO|nr:hypothetical protein CANARDRAFT_209378 [[Candida] arabinofermentans NRRL YB-2248]
MIRTVQLRPITRSLLRVSGFRSISLTQTRSYSHAPPLTKEIITERIIELLESYNKVKPGTVIDYSSSFHKDLGLDSFDTVEVIMEIEYEFSITIPDSDADSLKTVGQAVEYIAQQPDAC